MTLKILSWNIWEGKYLTSVIGFLKKSDADIIGLQEVIQEKGGKENIAELIASKLNYKFVYATASQIEKDGKTVDKGEAILSKHKIVGNKTHILSQTERRIAIEADIKVKNTILHVFNLHLIHTHQRPSDIQSLQVENLVRILPIEATILMGDFNAIPQSAAIKRVSKVLKNTDNSGIPTWSVYPEGCEVCKPHSIEHKLDYIFTSEDIKSKLYKVKRSEGSDHLPVLAVIEV